MARRTPSKRPPRAGRRNPTEGAGPELYDALVLANYGKTLALETDQPGVLAALPLRRLGYIACGDRVRWKRQPDGQAVVMERLDRRTRLERVDNRGRVRTLAANLDLLAVVAADPPGFDDRLIDSYLVMAAYLDAKPLLVLNKSDLWQSEASAAAERLHRLYTAIGCPVVSISTQTGRGMSELTAALADHVAILVGQSGVGKSSIVSRLLPDRDIRVGELSAATGLGSHTTTTTILYRLPAGGALIDSPGVRAFALDHLPDAAIRTGFGEIHALAAQCRFHNCRHLREPGCAVRAAADSGRIAPSRYRNYRMFSSENETAAV